MADFERKPVAVLAADHAGCGGLIRIGEVAPPRMFTLRHEVGAGKFLFVEVLKSGGGPE